MADKSPDPTNPTKWLVSRRALLRIGGLGLAMVASYAAFRKFLDRRKDVAWSPPPRGGMSVEPFERSKLQSLAAYTGHLFGVELSESESDELVWCFGYLLAEQDGWRPHFEWAAAHLDLLAKDRGAAGFIAAPVTVQREISLESASQEVIVKSRWSELKSIVLVSEKNRRDFYRHTLWKLRGIYMSSGVPWRRRGYTTWVGIPADAREYARAGNPRP